MLLISQLSSPYVWNVFLIKSTLFYKLFDHLQSQLNILEETIQTQSPSYSLRLIEVSLSYNFNH